MFLPVPKIKNTVFYGLQHFTVNFRVLGKIIKFTVFTVSTVTWEVCSYSLHKERQNMVKGRETILLHKKKKRQAQVIRRLFKILSNRMHSSLYAYFPSLSSECRLQGFQNKLFQKIMTKMKNIYYEYFCHLF